MKLNELVDCNRQPDRPQHPFQQKKILPGKHLALDVLIASRHIADDHHLRRGIAAGKAQIARGLFQREIVQCKQCRLKLLQ